VITSIRQDTFISHLRLLNQFNSFFPLYIVISFSGPKNDQIFEKDCGNLETKTKYRVNGRIISTTRWCVSAFSSLTKARDTARHADPAQCYRRSNPSPIPFLPSHPFVALPCRMTGVYPSSLGVGERASVTLPILRRDSGARS